MKKTAENFWPLCLEKFSKELTKQQLNTWIKPLEFKIQGAKAQIIAPNQFILQWVKEKFSSQIQTLLKEHLHNVTVEYIVNIKNKEKRLAFEIVQTNNENEGKPAVDFKKYLKQ